MKKKWLWIIVAMIVAFVILHGNVISFKPKLFDSGKEYVTIWADNIDGTVFLVAMEKNRELHTGKNLEMFMMPKSKDHGFPPSKFSIRFGSVYPLEWSKNWGDQKFP